MLPGKLQKLAQNSSWLLVERVLRLGAGLLFNIWLARYLGPGEYGLFNYATAFVTLFSIFVTLGLDAVVVRDLVRAPERREVILGSVLVLRLAGALAALALSAAAAVTADRRVAALVVILALGNLFQAFDTLDLWFQARLQSRRTVAVKSAALLLLTGVRLLLIVWRAPLTAFAWAATAELALGAAGLWWSYQRYQRQQGQPDAGLWRWRVQAAALRELARASWPLWLNGLALLAQARLDQVLLGRLVNTAEVGQYAVALRLVEVLGLLSVVVQTSAAPLVTRAKARGEAAYYDVLLNLYRLMFVLFVLTALPLCQLAGGLVTALFGAQYAAAGALLPWFAPRLFFTNFGVAKQLFLVNDNLLRYALVTALAGAALNLVLNLLWIPRYGAHGALAAMTVSSCVNLCGLDLFFPAARRNLRAMVIGGLTAWRLRAPAAARELQP